jgi:hypothetical protein
MTTEKRKLPRFHITPCQFHEAPSGKNFSVQDVSQGGLALRLVERSDLPSFAVGSEHHGIIKIEGLKTECHFQVKYIRGTLIGGEWRTPSGILEQHLEEISHAEKIGAGLRLYDLPEVTGTVWYHHPVGIDLLFYPPGGDSASSSVVGRWTAYIHQSYVQWELEAGIHTGKTMAEDEEGYAHGIVRLETRLLEEDEKIDVQLVRWVEKMVENCELLKPELKNLVLSHLKGIA